MSHAASADDGSRQQGRAESGGDGKGRGKVTKAGLFDIRTFIAADERQRPALLPELKLRVPPSPGGGADCHEP